MKWSNAIYVRVCRLPYFVIRALASSLSESMFTCGAMLEDAEGLDRKRQTKKNLEVVVTLCFYDFFCEGWIDIATAVTFHMYFHNEDRGKVFLHLLITSPRTG